MPSINDLTRGNNGRGRKPGKKSATRKKAAADGFSRGDVASKVRSKNGLPPGFRGMVRTAEGAVSLIQVDKRGREKATLSYIPDAAPSAPKPRPRQL